MPDAFRLPALPLAVLLCKLPLLAQQPTLSEGLVLYYPFNGSATDASGRQNHGMVHGAMPASDRFGRPSSAYAFNGTGAYIEASALPEMVSTTISLWLAMDSWVQVRDWGAPQVLFFEGDDGSGHDLAIYALGGFHFATKPDAGLSAVNWLPKTNTWTHLVCVANSEAQTMSLWADGKMLKQGPFTGRANSGFHAPLNLGRRPGVYNDWYFAGRMDDVRVYERALGGEEIALLHRHEAGTARTLEIGVQTVELTLYLSPGSRYLLQVSDDLASWSAYGEAFVAVSAEQRVSADASRWGRYWRVVPVP